MRPIKFRAWNDIEKIMIDWNTLQASPVLFMNILKGRVKHHQLMQFTGLQDKNGVDIYEGELISLHDNQRGFTKVVFKNAYIGGWLLVRNNNACSLGARRQEDLEVVGNIPQNPELLEELK